MMSGSLYADRSRGLSIHRLFCWVLHNVSINDGTENYQLQYFNNEQWRHNMESADFAPNQAALNFKTSIIITHSCYSFSSAISICIFHSIIKPNTHKTIPFHQPRIITPIYPIKIDVINMPIRVRSNPTPRQCIPWQSTSSAYTGTTPSITHSDKIHPIPPPHQLPHPPYRQKQQQNPQETMIIDNGEILKTTERDPQPETNNITTLQMILFTKALVYRHRQCCHHPKLRCCRFS